MRTFTVFLSLLLAVMLPVTASAALFEDDCPAPAVSGAGASYETAFSSGDQVAALVVKSIQGAKKSIKLTSREFNSKIVSQALLTASRTGKQVQVIIDKTHNKDGYTDAGFLITMGSPAHELKSRGQSQNYIIIDDNDLVVGNLTELPEADSEKQNAVSVLVIHNAPELVKKYEANWKILWADSEEMKEKKDKK